MTEPPNPWGDAGRPPDDDQGAQSGGWGSAAPGPWGTPPQPPGPWSTPQAPQQNPGNFAPPPGWAQPPPKKMTAGQIFSGIGAWFAVNFLLFGLLREAAQGGEGLGLLVLGVNAAMIIGPAVKGHKGFAVGYALGFVVATLLFVAACFLLIASFGSN